MPYAYSEAPKLTASSVRSLSPLSYSASALLSDVSAATNELPTSLPPPMVLLGRAVIQLEGLALRADPGYRIVDDILPTAARIGLANCD